jgi:predicted nucleotidyltransferase
MRVPDCAEGLENRLYDAISRGRTLDEVIALAKSRRYAASRLRRMLLCAALGVERGMNTAAPPYARVLAANETGLALLAEMRQSAKVPVITKSAHGAYEPIFRLTAAARALYALGTGERPDSDYTATPYIQKT